MDVNIGDIVLGDVALAHLPHLKQCPVLIITKPDGNGNLLGLLLNAHEPDSNSPWKICISAGEADIPSNASISVSYPYIIHKTSCRAIHGKVKKEFLDYILRLFVKFSADVYFEASSPGDSFAVPPSGKVLDGKDLANMIDASLDMWLTSGRFNDEFEEKLAVHLGMKYALTTNSGSSANLLAISALTSHQLGERKLKDGDEVITVAAGFPTTVSPIIQNRLVPVFVDIELGAYNIDVSQIEEAISKKTKALFVAHTLGNPFNLDRVMELCDKYNLWLIEDNCDALGSTYGNRQTGTFGHISTMSFYPAHHITMGEGGAVITNDGSLYRILMSFRDWGRDCWCQPGKDNSCGKRFGWKLGNLPEGYDHKYIYSHIGYNLKITDWQAAIGLAQLEKLPLFTERRRENFRLLYEGLQAFEDYFILPRATERSNPSWFGFPLTVRENKIFSKIDIVTFLEDSRIGTRQLFAGNMLRQPAFIQTPLRLRIRNSPLLNSQRLSEKHYRMLPNSDAVMKNTFWIGLWPGIDKSAIQSVLGRFDDFIKSRKAGV